MVDTNPLKGGLSDDYKKLNPLAKIPTFQGSDGYVLNEVIAIAIYRESSHLSLSLRILLATSCRSHMMKQYTSFSYPCLNQTLVLRPVFTL